MDGEGWQGLALAAVDFVFRNYLAVDLPDSRLVPLISPRFGVHRGVMAPGSDLSGVEQERVRRFPGPVPAARPGPMHRMIYALIGGHWDNHADRERAAEVLDALWWLVKATAARDVGCGVWRIAFEKTAVVRLDRAFLCPVTRRLFGYGVAARSPYSLRPDDRLVDTPVMEEVTLPRLPFANCGGLDEAGREKMARWCETDARVAALRCAAAASGRTCTTASQPTLPFCEPRSIRHRSTARCSRLIWSNSRTARSTCSTAPRPWRWGWTSRRFGWW
jgi:hypothetical protein